MCLTLPRPWRAQMPRSALLRAAQATEGWVVHLSRWLLEAAATGTSQKGPLEDMLALCREPFGFDALVDYARATGHVSRAAVLAGIERSFQPNDDKRLVCRAYAVQLGRTMGRLRDATLRGLLKGSNGDDACAALHPEPSPTRSVGIFGFLLLPLGVLEQLLWYNLRVACVAVH